MESKADMLSRVCLMAEGSETWDLSDNDTRALRHVLAERNDFKQSSEVSALRIRELESELQVSDDMGDEVLRTLREATGRRDFHSEMEAAEWAARMILDLQTQLFLEKQSSKEAMSREAAAVSREIGLRAELAEARLDAARLDWLESHNIIPMPIESEMMRAVGGYRVKGERFNSLRAAIDAAMEGK